MSSYWKGGIELDDMRDTQCGAVCPGKREVVCHLQLGHASDHEGAIPGIGAHTWQAGIAMEAKGHG